MDRENGAEEKAEKPVSPPFKRGPFESLPERPRVPHIYYETRAIEVRVTTPEMGQIRTSVRVHGSGPPLLLLHGLMTSSYSFRYVLAPLGLAYTVYAPDLPGAGQSDSPTEPDYSPKNLAKFIGTLQRELGIRGGHVIANSMGGYLAMQLALSDPPSISRLVNVHSPGVPEARLYALHAALSVPGAKSALVRFIRRDPQRWAHANVHYYDESLKSREEAREYGAPLATEEGARAFVKYLAETMAPGPMVEFQRELAQRHARRLPFPVPILHLYARSDPMVPPKFGNIFAKLTGGPIVWLNEASHFAHVDAVDRFLPPVLEFLSRE